MRQGIDTEKLGKTWWTKPLKNGWKFKLKPLAASDRFNIAARHTTETEGGERVLDEGAANVEILMRSLVDWEGLTDKAGEPIPCTEENKLKVLEHVDGLAEYLLEKVMDLQAKFEMPEEPEDEEGAAEESPVPDPGEASTEAGGE